jgi:hypothetical protein
MAVAIPSQFGELPTFATLAVRAIPPSRPRDLSPGLEPRSSRDAALDAFGSIDR